MSAPRPDEVHVVSHTHWDREWYHPAGVFRQRLAALVDELLDDDESARPFLLDGQAVVLEDYLAVRPERREALAERLRAGVLEAGPWYVLADELIPSGEALVRNLLHGWRTLRALGAEPPPVLYSPDAFGHPAALPALAAGFGLPLVVLWRGYGGEGWPSGDTVRWRAPGGETVLVHHLPPDGYEYGSNLPPDDDAAAERWRRLRAVLEPRMRAGAMLVLNGADHHARQESLPRALDALARAAAPITVSPSTLTAFARSVVTGAPGELPVVDGELRSSYGYTWALQGTFGGRAHLKRENALVERLLVRDAEPWAALAARAGRPMGHLLAAAWRTLLLCHPHDTLCGCSVDIVARAMAARLEDARTQGEEIRARALEGVLGHNPVAVRTRVSDWRARVLVRNAAARSRGGVAELEISLTRQQVPVGPGSGAPHEDPPREPRFSLGADVPWQLLGHVVRHERTESPRHYPRNDLVDVFRVCAWVPPVAGYAVETLVLDAEGGASAASQFGGAVRVESGEMGNEHLAVSITPDGDVRLRSSAWREPITSLLGFEDVGDAGDLYTASPIGPRVTHATLVSQRVVHAGPMRGEIEAVYRLRVPASSSRAGRSADLMEFDVHVAFVLDAGARFLRVRLWGENAAHDHRLRARFRLGVRGAHFADAAFATVERGPIVVSAAAAAIEQPPPTAPLHRFVTLAGADRGATLYSDGLAEYEATPEGDFAVTLVRAVGELSRNDLPERPGHAGWPVPAPEAQSLGPFEAQFAVMLHGARDDATIVAIERAADDFLLPLRGYTLRSAIDITRRSRGVALEGDGLAFSACKESEDGRWTLLRCVNLLDRPVRGAWSLAGVREARLARLDETVVARIAVTDDTIAFDAGARDIVTILAR
jgi:alpha-mannosidase